MSAVASALDSPATMVLITICAILVMLPPKFDPAIRFKEWNERNRRRG